jgi:hypothetical protein
MKSMGYHPLADLFTVAWSFVLEDDVGFHG